MRLLVLTLAFSVVLTKKAPKEAKPDWAKKDVRDYRFVFSLKISDIYLKNSNSPVIQRDISDITFS